MKIIRKVVPANFNLFLFGDDHEGTTLRYRKGWNKLCDMMQSHYEGVNPRNNFGWHHGDPIEAIMIDDPRYDPDTVKDPSIMTQIDNAVNNLEPIKTQIIGMNEGNHPLKLWRFGAITQEICKQVGIEYGTWSSKIIFEDKKGRLLFKSYHTHGRKNISSVADDPIRAKTNQKLILKRHLKYKMGDCVLMCKGHSHKLLVQEPTSQLYIVDDGRETRQKYTRAEHTASWIHPDHRWYCNSGSFLKLYGENISGYAEIGEYDPIELGFAICRVRNREIQGIDKIVV